MDDRIEQLARDVRQLRRYSTIVTALLIGVGVMAFRPRSTAQDVLRVRGIVIVDGNNRERILIGAPIPDAKNRVRTDSARAHAAWGSIHPRYMEWYKSYRHSMNGMLVLDESGFDRVAIGDSTPDPNIGRRIGPSTGFVFNDPKGYERGGFGTIQLGKELRVSLGLDSKRGSEGISLSVDDNDMAQVRVQDQTRNARFGIFTVPSSGGGADTIVGAQFKRGDQTKVISSTTP